MNGFVDPLVKTHFQDIMRWNKKFLCVKITSKMMLKTIFLCHSFVLYGKPELEFSSLIYCVYDCRSNSHRILSTSRVALTPILKSTWETFRGTALVVTVRTTKHPSISIGGQSPSGKQALISGPVIQLKTQMCSTPAYYFYKF